jgi:hypothetical protein
MSWISGDHCFLLSLCAFVLGRALYFIYLRLMWDEVRVNGPAKRAYVQTRIRDFWVTSEEGEQRVRDFYAWLDTLPEPNEAVHRRCREYNLHTRVKFSSYQVRKLLSELYHQDSMWHNLDVPGDPSYEHAQLWLKLVEDTYVKHVSRFFKQFDTAQTTSVKVPLMTRFMRDLILFSNLLTHAESRFTDSVLTRTVYKKVLELSATTGFLPAFLVMGHLKPDLVCDDCYPVLNNDTQVYQELVVLDDLVDDATFGPLVNTFEDFIIL